MFVKKGSHCRNNCKFFYEQDETIYNPHHSGDPGSTDYEVMRLYCYFNADGFLLPSTICNCPFYQSSAPSVASKVIEDSPF